MFFFSYIIFAFLLASTDNNVYKRNRTYTYLACVCAGGLVCVGIFKDSKFTHIHTKIQHTSGSKNKFSSSCCSSSSNSNNQGDRNHANACFPVQEHFMIFGIILLIHIFAYFALKSIFFHELVYTA